MEDLDEEVRKEANRTKRAANLKKGEEVAEHHQETRGEATKIIIPNLMTRVLMIRLDPTTITPRLRARLPVREKVNVEEKNKNEPDGRLGRL